MLFRFVSVKLPGKILDSCFFNDVIIKCLYYVVIEKALVLDKKIGKQWEINKNCRKSTVNEKFNRKKLFLLYKICYHNL